MLGFQDDRIILSTRLTGVVEWTPPPWILRLRDALRARIEQARASGAAGTLAVVRRVVFAPQELPRRSFVVALALLASIPVVFLATRWYLSRPRPAIFAVEVTAPAAMPLAENARPSPLVIRIHGAAARLGDVGKKVASGVTLAPPFPGEWRWESDSQLIFTPRLDWPVGKKFRLRLQRSMFPEHVRLDTYALEFETARFGVTVKEAQFYQDPRDPKVKRAVWTLSFTHPVQQAELEKRLSLKSPGQGGGSWFSLGAESVSYTVQYDKWKGEAYVQSAVLGIPEKDSSITLEVSGGVKSSRGGPAWEPGLASAVSVPGMFTYFNLSGTDIALPRNERYEPEQALVLQFSAGAREEEVRAHVKAWLLPKDKARGGGRPPFPNYPWADAAQIGPELLAQSTPVELDPVPAEKDFAPQHSFRFHAPAGRWLFVQVTKGARSLGGYVLAKTTERSLQVPAFPRELQIMAEGALLSLGGERKLSIVSRGVDAMRFEIGRVVSGNINHLVSQTGGRFTSPEFENYRFTGDNITERFTQITDLKNPAPEKTQYSALDLGQYLDGSDGRQHGLFLVKVQSWDPLRKAASEPEDKRLILVTDLGLVVKNDRYGGHEVYVMSIREGAPVAGARVEVLGLNGVAVLSATTDGQGRASFPSLQSFEREKKPVAYVARLGQDLSFIPYEWGDRRLDTARFDVGGISPSAADGGMSAYFFSDRGIYRPGDEIRAGLVVKGSDWTRDYAGVPIEVTVTDPRGLEVLKRKMTLPASGFVELRHATDETSPTGHYELNAFIIKDQYRGSLLGSTGVRVEEFLPDRMKIDTRLSRERARGWVSPKDLKGRVTLRNLFGVAAADRKVSAEIMLDPAPPVFPTLADYVFLDPLRAKRSFSERLQDGKTDGEGEAEFDLDLSRFERATYRLLFSAVGHESEGGRSVSAQSSVLVSDLSHLVGWKGDGDLLRMHKDSDRSVELIAIDPELKRVPLQGLKAVILEQRYVSVLEKRDNGTFQYRSVLRETPASSKPISLPEQGLRTKLPTDRPGDFALVVQDAEDTVLSRTPFAVVGAANLSRSLEKNAELQVRLDRADYSAGDEIEVQLQAPYTGAGLITVERDRVYAARWFKAGTTSSVHKIRIPEGLEGNAYVSVAFVRSLDSAEIFTSPLSFGVAPFSLSRAKRTNEVTLETADVARPGEPFRIRYKTTRPGRAVVFAIDEGILQVAGYKTPDPLGHFLAKRALEVQTLQTLDLVLPEFRQLQALSAPGGDAASRALGQNLNPFKRRRDKPVAYWSGIVETGPDARDLTYDVPDHFNGSLRVMAVAISPDSMGASQRSSLVRAIYTISPNAPTFAAPGDEFAVSVAVANNEEGSGAGAKLSLKLDASKHVDVLDGAERQLTVDEGREATATFRVRVKESPGSARLAFLASRGDKSSKAAVEFSVRPPVPFRTTVSAGVFRDGKAEAAVGRKLYPEFRELSASASSVPLVLAHGLAQYLKKYPYGCTEQVVSGGWPALVLKAHPGFGYTADAAETAFGSVLRTLRSRQNSEGTFGFWAANSTISEFHSVYAMHFLIDAKELGYPVPKDVVDRGLVFLRGLASGESADPAGERLRAYAAYVLARNGILAGHYAAAIQSRLESRGDPSWKADIALGFLAATYQIHRDERKARKLFDSLKPRGPGESDYEHYYDPLTHRSQYLYLLARHFPDRLPSVRPDDLQELADEVAKQKFNTVSAAYTILALGALADASGPPSASGLKITELLPSGASHPLQPGEGLFAKASFSQDAARIRFSGDGLVFHQTTQAGFDRTPPTTELAQGLEVHREFVDAGGSVLRTVTLGEEVNVRVRVRAIDKPQSNVAIIDLLPGGFEPVTDSLPRWAAAAVPGRPAMGDGCGEESEEGCEEPPEEAAEAAPGGWQPDYVDVREDRVVIFGTIGTSLQELTYKVRATNRGKYITPGAYAESMYDRQLQAQTAAAPVEVK